MILIRKSNERGHFDHGWLNTFHTFSFSSYQDPKFMGFRALRVINEDFVAKADGFDEHPHQDMEIITYIVEGQLEHKDSMGNGSIILPGDVQYMSAGSGVTHSEFNPSKSEEVHLLQIWIIPDKSKLGAKPQYGQKSYTREERSGVLKQVVGPDSIAIRQDVKILASILKPGQKTEHALDPNRYSWVQLIKGAITLNGEKLEAGDGAGLAQESVLRFESVGKTEAEFLVFDLN